MKTSSTLALFVVGMGLAINVCAQTPHQPSFQLISGPFNSWTEAKADAESRGGHLATITSLSEWQQMTNQIGSAITNNHYWWLGASDVEQEGVWRWVTGEAFSFSCWASGEPSGTGVNGKEDYVCLSSQWTWYDAAHSIQFPFGYVLEYEPYSFLTNDLVAHFPFNGNANDASGNGHNGTVTGATLTTDRFGQTNQAYLFGGPAAYITVPLNAAIFSNDFTASVWFNASDINNGWPTLLHEQGVSAAYTPFNLQIAGLTSGSTGIGHLIADATISGPSFNWLLDRANQTPIGTYCQAVVTKAGTQVTMYLNSQVTVTGNVTTPITQTGETLWIGRAPTEDLKGAYVFHGVIDDIRIYNRALSADEVAELYEIESGPRVDLIKAVKPSFSGLYVGMNYQLQVSTDMSNWTNYGDPFPATNSAMVYPRYWDMDNWGKLFFQIKTATP